MIESSLQCLCYSDFDQISVKKIIQSIIPDIEKFGIKDYESVADSIHFLFLKSNGGVKAQILYLCAEIELFSEDYITEDLHFDSLIVILLENRTSDYLNEEKAAAFSYTSLLIQCCGILPSSVQNSLISLYHSQFSEYIPLVISILAQSILLCDNIVNWYDIGRIFISYASQSFSQNVISLIAFMAERDHPIIRSDHYTSKIISLYAQLGLNQIPCNHISVTSTIKLLSTWPGIIRFGIKGDMLLNLVRCFSHYPTAISFILKSIISLSTDPRISDSFSGFILYFLIDMGILDIANQVSGLHSSISDFIEEIYPFLDEIHLRKLSIQSVSPRRGQVPLKNNHTSMVFKLAQSYPTSQNITTIKSFILPPDMILWEWHHIHKLLFVILPNNDAESQSQCAMSFYPKLIDCFCTSFLTAQAVKAAAMADSLDALFSLFISTKELWSLIETNCNFKRTLEMTLSLLSSPNPLDSTSPHWYLFKFLSQMMSNYVPYEIVIKWDFEAKIIGLGDANVNIENAVIVMKYISFLPKPTLALKLFAKFFESPNLVIFKSAISEICRKRPGIPSFSTSVFIPLIVPYVKTLGDHNIKEKIPYVLNLLYEILRFDEGCLNYMISDIEILMFLYEYSREIYSVVLSNESVFKVIDVQKEIEYWMQEGNKNYVNILEATVDAIINKLLPDKIINQYPSVLSLSGYHEFPPHLFGQLSKNIKGQALLTPELANLLKGLKSEFNKERRACILALCHYASSPLSNDTVIHMGIIELLFQSMNTSRSYKTFGVFVFGLALCQKSEHFMEVVLKNKWRAFHFGGRVSFVPNDSSCIPFQNSPYVFSMPEVSVSPNNPKLASIIRQISNPTLAKDADKELKRMHKNEISHPNDSRFVFSMLGSFSYLPIQRKMIQDCFNSISLRYPPLRPLENVLSYYQAIFYHVINSQESIRLSSVCIPKSSISNINLSLINISVPEQYIDELTFKDTFQVSIDQFYLLSQDQMRTIRQKILNGQ